MARIYVYPVSIRGQVFLAAFCFLVAAEAANTARGAPFGPSMFFVLVSLVFGFAGVMALLNGCRIIGGWLRMLFGWRR